MEVIATIVAAVLVAPLALLTAAFAVEVFVGLRAMRAPVAADTGSRTVIVMPANDEAAVITRTLTLLAAELPQHFHVLVIADNCTDHTADLAEQAGVEVLRRHDPIRRGKGFALAYARDHLATRDEQCGVVVVLDADCTIDRASLTTLAATARDAPAQASYLMQPERDAAPMVQVSNFAFAIKNLVRQRGLQRLAGRVNLTGTGMAFPWPVFRDAPLATDDIVEDLALGLELAQRGTPPHFAAQATVWSAASSAEGTLKQRTRWEGGFLATSKRHALPTIAAGLRAGSLRMIWAGLSLAIPPLTLLLLLDVAGLAALAALALVGAAVWPVLLLGALLLLALAVLVAAWARVGRPFLSGAAAVRLPLYILWKIPLYLGLARKRPTDWLRAGR